MRVHDANDVIADHVDHVDVGNPGPQLADHLAPVFGQHGVQLALVLTQRGVPGQDVVSVGQVKDWGGERRCSFQKVVKTKTLQLDGTWMEQLVLVTLLQPPATTKT